VGIGVRFSAPQASAVGLVGIEKDIEIYDSSAWNAATHYFAED
jgi:hypothetical protein